MPDVCQVANCRGESKYSRGYALFSVPTDPDLREKWLVFLGHDREAALVKSAKICSYHFEERYIKHNKKRVRLSRSAVPSLHPPKPKKTLRSVRKWTKGTDAACVECNMPFISCQDDSRCGTEFIDCSRNDEATVTESEVYEEKPWVDYLKSEVSYDPLCM